MLACRADRQPGLQPLPQQPRAAALVVAAGLQAAQPGQRRGRQLVPFPLAGGGEVGEPVLPGRDAEHGAQLGVGGAGLRDVGVREITHGGGGVGHGRSLDLGSTVHGTHAETGTV
ncbi:hypothetical protein GCM10022380_13400 [Amycolatopsis tucumanensis]|uniref:Uncharacterized protein n=1 Tax=Amycolatopsis tucumanensis TaxID=401106 RepID=A0ABP7HK83_9PSEU